MKAAAGCGDTTYCLITPCRNEAEYARRTIESVASQSVPPTLWVVVDDGSTDETPTILAEYARELPYLRIVRRADRGHRRVGAGVIEAFNEGLRTVRLEDFAYLCKLDLDVDLPPPYFELLMQRMAKNPRLGTCSGKPFYRLNGREHDEVCGDENSVGMTKFYRRECFLEIGGFEPRLMWDGIDCHRCRMLGWIAVGWNDPRLRFEHLRPMGSSDVGLWRGRVRHGEGQYSMGAGPAYLAASALFRIGSQPAIVGSIAMVWGYVASALRGVGRHQDEAFLRFLRGYQRRSLLLGKDRTVRALNDQGEAVWLSRHGAQSHAPLTDQVRAGVETGALGSPT